MASISREERREPQKIYHRLERDGLLKAAPDFAWADYFTRLGVADVSAINVEEPDFIKGFDALLLAGAPCVVENAEAKPPAGEATPKRKGAAAKGCAAPAQKFPAAEWKAYLRWHTIRAAASSLSSSFVDERFHFEQTLTGAEKLPPRWKRCVRVGRRRARRGAGASRSSQDARRRGQGGDEAMVANIEQAMSEDLEHARLDGRRRRAQRAHEKLAAIANKIGYPDKWRSYDALTIERGDYLGNRMRADAFEVKRELDKIGKPARPHASGR